MDDTRNAILDYIDHLCKVFRSVSSEASKPVARKYHMSATPSVTLLGQYVRWTWDVYKRRRRRLRPSHHCAVHKNLRDLEMFLGLTGWLRSSIERYAQRADPLQKRTVMLNKGLGTVAARSLRPGRNGRN